MIRSWLTASVIALVLVSEGAAQTRTAPSLAIQKDTVRVRGAAGFRIAWTLRQTAPGIQTVAVRLTSETPRVPDAVTVSFRFPSIDVNGFWNGHQNVDKVNYYRSGVRAGASAAAPVLCYYDNRLHNRITFAVSDALNTVRIDCGLKEEDVHFYPTVRLFTERTPPRKTFAVEIRIDTRPVLYHEALDAMRAWWASMDAYRPAAVPDLARRPMYSTWYGYHQQLDPDAIVAECRIARTIGCHAVIVDDGWQTKDGNRGYAYTGDWKPVRIPKMKAFVDAVHAADMKFVLWYALPFIGEKAENHARFKGKYLYHWRGQRTHVLDPRYPAVRAFIAGTYERAMREWGVDGFKLDFIGWFKARGDTKLTAEDGRDFASVSAATDHLMTDVTKRLTRLRPDVLLEFRQPYVGPVMRKYGNMFRGVDCPNNAAANRNEIVNLRMLSGETAVHSDMVIWRKEEPVESAALQLLNVLFSVPQISVRLAEIPKAHLDMCRTWLGYWNENRAVLLDGAFIPGNPGANFPIVTAVGGTKQISALYETPVVRVRDGVRVLDVVNATGGAHVFVDVPDGRTITSIRTWTCVGADSGANDVALGAGAHRIRVPRSGLLRCTLAE